MLHTRIVSLRPRTLLLAPLLLSACTTSEPDPYVPQMGYVIKTGAQFQVRFRTSPLLGSQFSLADGAAAVPWLECELDASAPEPRDGAVRRRLFRAPVVVSRRGRITPDGRFQFAATGDFTEAGGTAGPRQLADKEIEAAIAGRTAIPCRFLVPAEGDREAVIASMELPSKYVHAAILGIPPSEVGPDGTREGRSR